MWWRANRAPSHRLPRASSTCALSSTLAAAVSFRFICNHLSHSLDCRDCAAIRTTMCWASPMVRFAHLSVSEFLRLTLTVDSIDQLRRLITSAINCSRHCRSFAIVVSLCVGLFDFFSFMSVAEFLARRWYNNLIDLTLVFLVVVQTENQAPV